MQGLMQSTPLTLVAAFTRAERLFADKAIVTAAPAGVQRDLAGVHRRKEVLAQEAQVVADPQHTARLGAGLRQLTEGGRHGIKEGQRESDARTA